MLNLLLIDDNEDDRVLIIYELRREFPELQVAAYTPQLHTGLVADALQPEDERSGSR